MYLFIITYSLHYIVVEHVNIIHRSSKTIAFCESNILLLQPIKIFIRDVSYMSMGEVFTYRHHRRRHHLHHLPLRRREPPQHRPMHLCPSRSPRFPHPGRYPKRSKQHVMQEQSTPRYFKLGAHFKVD